MDYRVGTEVPAKGKTVLQKIIKGEKVESESSGLSESGMNNGSF